MTHDNTAYNINDVIDQLQLEEYNILQSPLFNEQCPPPPQEIDRLPTQRDICGAWTNYGLNTNGVNVTDAIVLLSLSPYTKFTILSGLL